MASDDSYTSDRDRLLPDEFKEHFESYRETCKKNIEIIKSLSDHSESNSEITIHHLLTKIYGDMNGMSNDIEALFVAIFNIKKGYELQEKKIQNLKIELEKQGVTLQSFQEHGLILGWLGRFFKDRSKTSDL